VENKLILISLIVLFFLFLMSFLIIIPYDLDMVTSIGNTTNNTIGVGGIIVNRSITLNSSTIYDWDDIKPNLSVYLNYSEINNTYLSINGSNANSNIDIGSYDFTATNGYFDNIYNSVFIDSNYYNSTYVDSNYFNKTSTNSTGLINLTCDDGEILEFESSTGLWECGTDSTGSNTNAGTICNDGEYLNGDGNCYNIGDYVPYTGATSDVDLGTNDLILNTKTITSSSNNMVFNAVHGIFGYSIGLRGFRGSALGMESAGTNLDLSAGGSTVLSLDGTTKNAIFTKNVSANYFIGNGSQLTNLNYTIDTNYKTITNISYGVSEGIIPAVEGVAVFNRTNYVNVPYSGGSELDVTGIPYSLSGWINLGSINPARQQIAWDLGSYEGAGFQVSFPSNTAILRLSSSGANHGHNLGVVTPGDWNHYVLTIDGTNMRTYLNGVLTGTTTVGYTTVADVSGFMRFGCQAKGIDRYFNGSIDENMLFNKTLNQTEITSLYNLNRADYTGDTTDLIAYYKFDGTPNDFTDSESTNDGTGYLGAYTNGSLRIVIEGQQVYIDTETVDLTNVPINFVNNDTTITIENDGINFLINLTDSISHLFKLIGNLWITGNLSVDGNLNVEGTISNSLSHMHSLSTEIGVVSAVDTWYNITFNASLGDVENLEILTDNRTLVIDHDGHYTIGFGMGFQDDSLFPNADVSMRLTRNGIEIPGSYIESDTTKQNADVWAEHTTHVELSEGDMINMQYISSDTDVTIEQHDTYATQPFNAYGYLQEVIV